MSQYVYVFSCMCGLLHISMNRCWTQKDTHILWQTRINTHTRNPVFVSLFFLSVSFTLSRIHSANCSYYLFFWVCNTHSFWGFCTGRKLSLCVRFSLSLFPSLRPSLFPFLPLNLSLCPPPFSLLSLFFRGRNCMVTWDPRNWLRPSQILQTSIATYEL